MPSLNLFLEKYQPHIADSQNKLEIANAKKKVRKAAHTKTMDPAQPKRLTTSGNSAEKQNTVTSILKEPPNGENRSTRCLTTVNKDREDIELENA